MTLKRIGEIDFSLLFASIILTIFGILFIYSSGLTSLGVSVSNEHIKQITWAVAGVLIALIVALTDYRRLYDWSLYLYIFFIVLLIYTRFFGKLVNGARAWVGIGSFGIQPSEFAKITTILFLARYLDQSSRSHNSFFRFLVSCLIVFAPVLVILAQPDLGTALVFIPILLIMTYIAGLSLRYVSYLALIILLTGILTILPLWETYIMGGRFPSLLFITNSKVVLFLLFSFLLTTLISTFGFNRYKKNYFYWLAYGFSIGTISLLFSFAAQHVLKEYQVMRLIVFLNPNIDARGSGWNIIQSITAIGSGGFFGKGYLQGTQSHYRFLPEQSTDFIFSIFSEEWGFIGGIIVFSLFLLICLRLIRIMKTTSDPFGAYIAAGLSALYSFHFIINVGMTMGIMPITGIPLLFMSYGGSSLLASMIGIGLACSIYVRRYEH